MLVHDGFQGINDAVFLSDVGPDLFDVNGLFGLGQVLTEQLSNDAVPEVRFYEELGRPVFLAPLKDV